MTGWVLLSIAGTLTLLTALLFASAWVEDRFLSPEALVAAAVRSKSATPEQAEALAAQQLEHALPLRARSSSPLEVLEVLEAASRG